LYKPIWQNGAWMKLFSKKKNPQHDVLLNEIKKTKIALESAYSNFENVIDPDLIDCYIYEVNAVQKRYKFLLKQAKEMDNDLSTI
jgi:hypothetical protein